MALRLLGRRLAAALDDARSIKSPPVWLASALQQAFASPFSTANSQNADQEEAPASTSSKQELLQAGSPLQSSPLQALDQTMADLAQSDPTLQHIKYQRQWRWYDETDEREWQQRELRRQYRDAGHAHLLNVPHSMQKMNRVLELVRGLQYDEAVNQCRMLSHKAARFTEQVLEEALQDALQKQLDRSRLVVDRIVATKGQYLKQRGYKGRGHGTMLINRRSHLQVILRELPVEYAGFRAQPVPHMLERLRHRQQRLLRQQAVGSRL